MTAWQQQPLLRAESVSQVPGVCGYTGQGNEPYSGPAPCLLRAEALHRGRHLPGYFWHGHDGAVDVAAGDSVRGHRGSVSSGICQAGSPGAVDPHCREQPGRCAVDCVRRIRARLFCLLSGWQH